MIDITKCANPVFLRYCRKESLENVLIIQTHTELVPFVDDSSPITSLLVEAKAPTIQLAKNVTKTSMLSVEERERWVLKDLSQQKNGKKRKHNMIHVLDAGNSGKILNALPT